MKLFKTRQENKEMTEQTEKEHVTEPHHTTHRSNKISRCWLLILLTQILKPVPPSWSFEKIPKHFDVHFNSSPEFKTYIYKLSKSIAMSF